MSAAVVLSPARSSPWRRALPALLLVLAAILLLYRGSFAAMVGIWSRSDTFAHAFLVPPIVLWLVWRRREALALLTPVAQPWMLLPMAAVAASWLVGDVAGVNAITQLAATALLVLAVPAVLGLRVAGALLFPLCFLFFMVPVGEFVMPTLMQWTADVTVFVLLSFGIPVYREGLQFVIPSGTWSVIEACSGVRYLIASFMVGTLFAYLNYRSTQRRVLFGIVSLAVPIVANWARAVIIVMLGHLSDNKIAAGVDHLIYGWVFFGIVIVLMFFIGARWAEAPADDVAPTVAAGGGPAGSWLQSWSTAVVALVLVALPQVATWRLTAADVAAPVLQMPALPGSTKQANGTPLHQPRFEGPKAEASAVYGEGPDAVTVHVAYYRQQTYGHKLVNSENMLVISEDPVWRRSAAGNTEIVVGTRRQPLRTAELRSGNVGAISGAQRLQVRQLYWVGGRWTTSDHLAALYGVAGQLGGHGDDGAALTFYIAGDNVDHANQALERFVARHLDDIGRWLAGVQAAR